jgi:hypothetical protein
MSQKVRRGGCALMALAAIGLTACGEDEEGATTAQPTSPEVTATETAPTTETAPQRTDTSEDGTDTAEEPGGGESPEDQPGGAGDEVPARSQALITGSGGRLSPRVVRVPPFISIRVELRSADGGDYALSARGRKLDAGGQLSAVSTTFAGLRPGKRLVLDGPQGRVVVEASAEPGP